MLQTYTYTQGPPPPHTDTHTHRCVREPYSMEQWGKEAAGQLVGGARKCVCVRVCVCVCSSVKFFYCNRAKDTVRFRPYDLVVVPRQKVRSCSDTHSG